ncbi:MAG: hypothetical protein AMJ93_15120 [Anaerolineae bacterium SM23_84]|nr:MAG: hypothetical protein AMJ93_15120 [Anaerolineae bacterium SM23_84]
MPEADGGNSSWNQRQCSSMANLGLLLSARMYAWVPEHAMGQLRGEARLVTRGVRESVSCWEHRHGRYKSQHEG